MKTERKEILKRTLLIFPVLIAVIGVGAMVRSRKGPEKLPLKETARQVRVITTRATDVVPRAIGYGYVEPGQVWQVVPEVSGKIIEVSPNFKKGSFVKKGDVLVRIDPNTYRLTVRQTEASVGNIQARLTELNRKEKNYQSSLEIEEKLLDLKKKELKRNQRALRSHSISDSTYDQAQMNYQTQLTRAQDIENALRLIPTTRKALEADLEQYRAKLEEARLDLRRTEIIVPFDCRITETSAEIGQYAPAGQSVATADGTATAEINTRIPMGKMAPLLRAVGGKPIRAGSEQTDQLRMDKIKQLFGLKVRVRLKAGSLEADWNADFARGDATIDAQTRTLGMIVVVENPYDQIIVGVRPPLVRNMFCEVEISGRPISQKVVIPRSAFHDGYVYVADSAHRLKRKPVTTDFAQTDFYVVREGLAPDEQLVVSDLIPAIEGMLLAPIEDKALSDRLMAQADGRSDIR
ncbi:efflux RND transporter periplasmic adaptor subun it [Desulfonema ishimotonii]|uniref:Efflux RND transporter periplasmic adaptor subun it n=1 Tax=Desulfonema ishimotonii TaxID=45657 RepID=A0A401G388_9BACT|nr:biotin/lipoyl-binding protein [Desulfonema ishimotonii]GBC63684.1 efflux RND transporter periplasmic adaptor subun it [Desulfonema ishimotonii]